MAVARAAAGAGDTGAGTAGGKRRTGSHAGRLLLAALLGAAPRRSPRIAGGPPRSSSNRAEWRPAMWTGCSPGRCSSARVTWKHSSASAASARGRTVSTRGQRRGSRSRHPLPKRQFGRSPRPSARRGNGSRAGTDSRDSAGWRNREARTRRFRTRRLARCPRRQKHGLRRRSRLPCPRVRPLPLRTRRRSSSVPPGPHRRPSAPTARAVP